MEFSAAISRTREEFQRLKDAAQEISETFFGRLLRSIAKFKPAIDGIVQAIADLERNVASAIEYFHGLDAAAQGSVQSTGAMADAANWLAGAIVRSTAYVEEFAVRTYQALREIASEFMSLTRSSRAGRAGRRR